MKELVGSRVLLPAFERFADADAVHDGDYRASFALHGSRVLRLANAMRTELGLTKSDRFAVMAANCHEFLELYHAAFLGAGIINPLNLRLAGRELQTILVDSASEVVFVDSLFAEHLLRNIEEVRADLPLKRVVLIGDRDVPHDVNYEDLIEAGEPVSPDEPEEDDPVVLMYTGGTTGLPKGALLDHRAEMLNLYHVGLAVDLSPGRVYLHQTPMFHAASMAAVIGIPATGSTSVTLPLFEPGAMLDLVEKHRVDWTVMVPTMIAMMINHPEFHPERLESLQDLVYGASPMPLTLLQRVQEVLPRLRLWQGYGMTECSSVLTFLTPADHHAGGDRLRSAGRAPLGVTISIQDTTGKLLGPGEQGEVCAQGGNFMREYWNRPKETEHVFEGGWYHTGDVGRLDSDGYLYLVDRVKDMIVTGGENVYSIEVENAISTHPAVADVAVIGIPHDTWGEQVHAIVVLKQGASVTVEEIQE
ncbi:MAG TPA: AMP-binding protein, partial [Acidimicrobiales bacterium]|nr:AMP-binding protein [Acidimicrobiales bacterium]